ncbi:hypothetical protein [Pseudoneobacillus sp. C159]
MKRQTTAALILVLIGMLVGCTDTTNESTTSTNKNSTVLESTKKIVSKNDENDTRSALEAWDAVDTNEFLRAVSDINDLEGTKLESNEGAEEVESLAQYSSEDIEYARVWLQLGSNQAIDELNVRHIPAGTPLNPDDETSASYPRDVIQLAGSRLVDGSVTYYENGDGTIVLYNIPLRWDGIYPAGEPFYQGILKETKLVSINPGDDEKVMELIRLLNVVD